MSNKELRMMEQLAFILRRLDTYSPANHEVRMMSDCMKSLILTIAGNEIDMGASPGGGRMLSPGQAVDQTALEMERRGGVRISENCVQYPAAVQTAPAPQRINQAGGGIESPQGSGAPIDVQAGVAALTGQGVAGAPIRPDLVPEPVEGSLMAAALGGQSVGSPVSVNRQSEADPAETKAMQEMENLLGDGGNGAPDPSDTQLQVSEEG